MKSVQWNKILIAFLFSAALLLLWELAVWLFQIPSYILPSPQRIIIALLTEFPTLLHHAITTLEETLLGLLFAVICGVLLAILLDLFPLLQSALSPILVFSQTVPVIVLAPLFIIYFGFGMLPKILIVVLMCFFPITINFSKGLAQVDIRQIHLIQSMGAKKWQVYWFVKIPAAIPALFSGLTIAATYSVSGAVVGEWLSSDRGLGYYMLRVNKGYMLDKVFACVLIIAFMSCMMNLLIKILYHSCVPYKHLK